MYSLSYRHQVGNKTIATAVRLGRGMIPKSDPSHEPVCQTENMIALNRPVRVVLIGSAVWYSAGPRILAMINSCLAISHVSMSSRGDNHVVGLPLRQGRVDCWMTRADRLAESKYGSDIV